MHDRRSIVCVALLLVLGASALQAAEDLRCSLCGQKITGDHYRIKKDGRSVPICTRCAERIKQAQELRCAICGKKISGKHAKMTVNGKKVPVCMACADERIPRCSVCGRRLAGQYYRLEENGKTLKLCKDCMRDRAPRCAICNRRVQGEHLRHKDGSVYCKACMKLPRCQACNRPLAPGTGVEKGGERFCKTCAARIRVCACCGEVIRGTGYSHPFTEGIFCEACENERPKCKSCGRPIAGDPILVGGTRPMCEDCFRTAVLTKKGMEAIFAEAKQILLEALDESTYHELPVEMVDDIAEVRKQAGMNGSHKELGLFKRTGERYRIYVLYGLSEALAYETLPHEWAHAWFAENGNRQHPQWVEEGFCQWVASHVLKAKDFTRGLRILESRDDLYGRGYRYIKAIEKQGGQKAVFRYVRTPPGKGKPHRKRERHTAAP